MWGSSGNHYFRMDQRCRSGSQLNDSLCNKRAELWSKIERTESVMAIQMSPRENVKLALQSISSNRLRTFLTALIIAIGITALVGILTSIDAIQHFLARKSVV